MKKKLYSESKLSTDRSQSWEPHAELSVGRPGLWDRSSLWRWVGLSRLDLVPPLSCLCCRRSSELPLGLAVRSPKARSSRVMDTWGSEGGPVL